MQKAIPDIFSNVPTDSSKTIGLSFFNEDKTEKVFNNLSSPFFFSIPRDNSDLPPFIKLIRVKNLNKTKL